MVKSFLVCYENLAVIVSVAAIIVTITVNNAIPRFVAIHKSISEEYKITKRQKSCSWLQLAVAIIILLLTIFVWSKRYTTHCKWAITPDLYGRTYDDAITVLYENGFYGQLALASTNENLTSTDCRVVWQSCTPDKEMPKGTKITFVIDDCFSLNSTPLIQYAYKDLAIDHTHKLEYECDYKDAIQQAAEQERNAIENGVPVEYSIADPHWMIEIDSADLKCEAHVSMRHGISFTKVSHEYSYRVYAGAMSVTLEELVTASATLLSGVALKPDLDECTIVGKLIPTSGQDKTVLCELPFPNHSDNNSKVFLPQTLLCGDYIFAFSIIDEDDQLFEWYHYISIVDKE